ncbi:hypothetical protein J8273_5217 [Carpediemonas membranifera]|uniref:Uncharacterized protein n=1 Tax=Carpediemonas membranifera TaxID=201153 RepID=A0A8J6B3K0_9EUKA|nr:hypothetical protein J8273_5217 [Carpediemonas membranifera]|eukprot:KAG9392234.1 hypothetical protein J8273_5217 [Carpediemonas membranifera]
MGEAAPQHDSAALGVEHALISAFRVSTVATASIPGDIPSLLRHAYSRHFNKVMPVERDAETTSASASSAELESLQTMLSRIPPLKPTAQALLDRARSILADGPPLSMNVELAEGQELPVALHTLLQGTLWAVMMASGADPDLIPLKPDEACFDIFGEEACNDSDYTEFDEAEEESYTDADKLPWFLCKKLYFTHEIAQKDGHSELHTGLYFRCIRTRHYAGRFFAGNPTFPKYHWLRCPPVLRHVMWTDTIFLVTAKGLYRQAGEEHLGTTPASRVRFSLCPEIQQYEADQPAWHKDRVVTDLVVGEGEVDLAMLLTPVGVAALSYSGTYVLVDDREDGENFAPVAMPDGFIPDQIMLDGATVIVSDGDRQAVGGANESGQLGLGHESEVIGVVEIPFHVERIFSFEEEATIFIIDGKPMIAGLVPIELTLAGALAPYTPTLGASRDPADVHCLVPTPLSPKLRRIFEGGHITTFEDESYIVLYVYSGADEDVFFTTQLPFEVVNLRKFYEDYDEGKVDLLMTDTMGDMYRVSADTDSADPAVTVVSWTKGRGGTMPMHVTVDLTKPGWG